MLRSIIISFSDLLLYYTAFSFHFSHALYVISFYFLHVFNEQIDGHTYGHREESHEKPFISIYTPCTHTYPSIRHPTRKVRPTVLYCTALYCTVLYCTVLYCTVLCCTVLYVMSWFQSPTAQLSNLFHWSTYSLCVISCSKIPLSCCYTCPWLLPLILTPIPDPDPYLCPLPLPYRLNLLLSIPPSDRVRVNIIRNILAPGESEDVEFTMTCAADSKIATTGKIGVNELIDWWVDRLTIR